MIDRSSDEGSPVLCAGCFKDRGLRLMATRFKSKSVLCPNCKKQTQHGLSHQQLILLSSLFFVRGSTVATDFGAAPAIQFNQFQEGSLEPDMLLAADVMLLQNVLGVGFFRYGPRLWMIGKVTPLEELEDPAMRSGVIDRILTEYPVVELLPGAEFYRVRKEPNSPADPLAYDAPPNQLVGKGRLDVPGRPMLYGSQDVDICVHECRFQAGDELYVAMLTPKRPLRVLDLTAILEEDCTEFESLDLAVLMAFLARSHAYPITRAISVAAAQSGFDGIIYPSYFSVLQTGTVPFETMLGISLRRLDQIEDSKDFERSKVIGNLGLFGHPIADGTVDVVGINRLVITKVAYEFTFGPVTY